MKMFQLARWDVEPSEKMAHSDALGARLVKDGAFGADLIKFPRGGRVGMHTHPGAHILIVMSGFGWVTVSGERHWLRAGVCYLIPSNEPHAIDADTDLSILSIANDHRDVASSERLDVVPE